MRTEQELQRKCDELAARHWELAASDRAKAYEFIRERIKAKRQAYFVCPRITSVEADVDIKAATDQWHRLSKEIFPEFKVSLIHGQMPSLQIEKTIRYYIDRELYHNQFLRKIIKLQLLIAQ